MEQISLFKSASQAIDSLDNGAEYYNIFTKADDDLISQSEVSKVAGVRLPKQKAVLFLKLAMSGLTEREQQEIEGRFDDRLSENFTKYNPEFVESVQAVEALNPGTGVIITGTPRKIEGEGVVSGYISIPVIDVFTLIPISETYIVYEIIDEASGNRVLVAHDKDAGLLPENKMKIAGVVKQFQLAQEDDSEFEKFIEVDYFVETI
ncbi:hypothetical protein M3B46_10420 [Sphingobacterium daejeonense]|uniref:hypothetical protein n=1 Tax=Sphingobacterium daejeonense TaxID=371142 RepID=UPI0021A5AD0D|nr:hypothetical protein [Sphingobacterium daejeonense]MCT1531409.1 hypothetical protein [Sphingobacterium daejeonense]